MVWKYKAGVNAKTLKGEKQALAYLKQFSAKEIKAILEFAYAWEGTMNMLLDDSIYCNHSDQPNAGAGGKDPDSSYALRNIKKGEEWFEDYGEYEYPAWYKRLLKKYKCDTSFFKMK